MNKHSVQQPFLKLFAGVLLIGFILITSLLVGPPPSSGSVVTMTQVVTVVPLPTGTSTAVGTPTYLQNLRATAIAIASTLPTASPYADWSPDKANGFQQQDLMRRAYGTAVTLYPSPAGYQPPLPTAPATSVAIPTEPIRSAGAGEIYDDAGEGEFATILVIANQWSETVGTQNIFVYAGRKSQRDDAQQGAVLVVTYDSSTYQIISGPTLYTTPTRTGLVRITDAVGERLTLRGQDDTLVYFDVPTHIWVASNGTPLPTPTLLPTAGP